MTTLLIDGDLVVFRLTSAAETEINWGEDFYTLHSDVRAVKSLFDGEILRLQKKFKTSKCVIAFSDKENFRRRVDMGYKANRTGRKPLAYRDMVAWVTREFKAVVCANLEADDVLGLRSGKDTVIVSWDKDMKQIPGKHYNPISDEVFEVSPEEGYRYFLTQVLTGDRVDGYTGLPGCGPVKAENILNASCTWDAVVAAYTKAGLEEHDALRQARLAYILKDSKDWNHKTGEVKLWTP